MQQPPVRADHPEADDATPPGANPGDALAPLPGELGVPSLAPGRPRAWSRKGVLALALLLCTLAAATVLSVQRYLSTYRKPEAAAQVMAAQQPAAATQQPRRLAVPVLPTAPASASRPGAPPPAPARPDAMALVGAPMVGTPTAHASVYPTPVGAPPAVTPKPVPPEDAPVLLVQAHPGALPLAAPEGAGTDGGAGGGPMATTQRNLAAYQRQLQGLLANLERGTSIANAQAGGPPPAGTLLAAQAPAPLAAPPSAAHTAEHTPRIAATLLANRSLTLPRGTAFTCALKTRVITAAAGQVGCQVQRNVYGDDGRVLLIERGSHLDGEYRMASLRPGTVRIPVVWQRLRTPLGVVVDINSPGTGALGEAGIDGHVDNRWGERVGAALLLSLIDDSVKLVIAQQADHNATGSGGGTLLLPGTVANTSKLAEKVLDSTIHIPPLIYQNQGGVVAIVVARDVDFSAVYELRPAPLPP